MRYLCLNQPGRGPRIPTQAEIMADHTSKRKITDIMENNEPEDCLPMKKAKRFRSAFTTEQIKYLETEFRKYPYIGSARRKEVSSALSIPERAVKIWFQNRRMKEKKDVTNNNADCDEHKHSRKEDAANDQLNNECTVTSTNNRHYASLPLMSPKNETPKNNDVTIKKEIETSPINDIKQNLNVINNNPSPSEVSTELYKKYNIYFGNHEKSEHKPFENGVASIPPIMQSPKNEVTSTSLYENLPQDLSRKRKPQFKPMRVVENSAGGYFPLNLKKYYTEPSMPVGGNMLWNPIQMMPVVPTGAPVSSPAQVPRKDCQCECRCHPATPPAPAPVLLQPGTASPLPQYVLTALPFPNPYYKYQ